VEQYNYLKKYKFETNSIIDGMSIQKIATKWNHSFEDCNVKYKIFCNWSKIC